MRLSIFPLTGVLLYPGLQLPLHIFEPRYRAMVTDALARDRRIGMIQPQRPEDNAPLFTVGCVGKIADVEALEDGRFNLVLEGEARFRLVRELEVITPFRQIEAELLEDPPHQRRLGVVHHQLPLAHVVAEGRVAAHPHAPLPRRRHLVANALANDLALELGKAEQDVQRQPPHAGGGIEALCDRNKRHVVRVEHLDQLGEIHQRATEPVEFVADDHVHQPGLDVGQQPLQRRPLEGAARYAAIVVALAHQHPAFGTLAGDERFTRLALRIERVEVHVEPFLARLPRVDRAAELSHRRRHGAGRLRVALHAALRLGRSPKNTRPFQRVPVMARAMAESDW